MAAPTSTSTMRYVRGTLDTTALPAASGYQINVGDLLVFHSGLAFPVQNGAAWNSGNELQNWSGYRADFAGVALSQHNAGDLTSGLVTVALNGIFSYPFPASSGVNYAPGTFVSFTQDQCSGYFHPQRLMQASGQASAIGKVVESVTPNASGQGQLTVYLQSTMAKGGIGN